MDTHENELVKFASVEQASGIRLSFFIPHGYRVHAQGWWCTAQTGEISSDADSQSQIQQLLDAAHFSLNRHISF